MNPSWKRQRKKFKIKVSDKEIDLELALMRSAQDKFDTAMQNLSAEQLRQKNTFTAYFR